MANDDDASDQSSLRSSGLALRDLCPAFETWLSTVREDKAAATVASKEQDRRGQGRRDTKYRGLDGPNKYFDKNRGPKVVGSLCERSGGVSFGVVTTKDSCLPK
mmetsp:Transcript_30327/g.45126  ORF Transcript_30327/g.45126 Transcript_30327/m.45126 type:complete len:104 (+) Transcript_30327:54-365(+)